MSDRQPSPSGGTVASSLLPDPPSVLFIQAEDRLRFFASLDQFNRAIQGSDSLEQMMQDALDALLVIFDCDRAFLVYPCNPDAQTWQSPMERTRPEYPGVVPLGMELPLEPAGAEVFRLLLNTPGPLVFGPESAYQVPVEMRQMFSVQSFIVMAIYPRIGEPWSFGLHQCSHPRVWMPEDQLLFQEIGRRLADGLSTLLAYRDLQESELRYREIFENVSDLIFLIDVTEDGRFIHAGANQVPERLKGMPVSVMKGKPLEDVLSPDSAANLIAKCRECLTTGDIVEYDVSFPIVGKGEKVKYLHTRITPIRNTAGRIYRLVGIAADVTAQKQIEALRHKQEREFRALGENSPDFVGRCDDSARFVYVNPPLEKLIGKPLAQILGHTAPEILPLRRDVETFHHIILQVLETGLPTERELLINDGGRQNLFYHQVRFVPERDQEGQVVSVLFVGRDISAQKQAELERERLLQQIQQHAQEVQFILDTVPEGMFLLSANGLVRLANGMAEQYLNLLAPGWETERLTHLGQSALADLLTSPPKGLWHDVAIEERRFEVIARSVENGPTNEGWVFVMRDVTASFFERVGTVAGTNVAGEY